MVNKEPRAREVAQISCADQSVLYRLFWIQKHDVHLGGGCYSANGKIQAYTLQLKLMQAANFTLCLNIIWTVHSILLFRYTKTPDESLYLYIYIHIYVLNRGGKAFLCKSSKFTVEEKVNTVICSIFQNITNIFLHIDHFHLALNAQQNLQNVIRVRLLPA